MTPESLYEALVEQLPGPWQPHEHGALIVLGDRLSFTVLIEPNDPSWTVASTDAIGYGARRSAKGIEEIPRALGWLVTSFVIGGSTTIRCLPEWLHPSIHQLTLERTQQLEGELERARGLRTLTKMAVAAQPTKIPEDTRKRVYDCDYCHDYDGPRDFGQWCEHCNRGSGRW